MLPRDYARVEFGLSQFTDDMVYGEEVKFKFKGSLREDQDQVRLVTEALEEIVPGRGGIVEVPCGGGKTVMALYLLSKWRRTTLVLVHKEPLAKQWEERAIEFLGLKPEEIGRVQGNKCQFEGKKLVIAMVESLASAARGKRKDYPQAFYDWPGVVVLDEVHRHAAETWHLAIGRFAAAYRLGLSATPDRRDGMMDAITLHTGPVVTFKENYQLEPLVYQIKFRMFIPDKAYYKWVAGELTDEVSMGRLINAVAKHERYNEMLAFYLANALDADRKVMLLSDRLKQIDELMKLTDFEVEREHSLGKYVGGMKAPARKKAAACDGVYATYHIASEGLDIPTLDTLVLGTPRSGVEQSIGRILRLSPGKKQPIVVDPVVSVDICQIMAERRARFYDDMGWQLEEIDWS